MDSELIEYIYDCIREAIGSDDIRIYRLNQSLFEVRWVAGGKQPYMWSDRRLSIYRDDGRLMIGTDRIKPWCVEDSIHDHDAFVNDLRVVLHYG